MKLSRLPAQVGWVFWRGNPGRPGAAGFVVGVLTFPGAGNVPGAVLAGLTAAGAAAVGPHQLVG